MFARHRKKQTEEPPSNEPTDTDHESVAAHPAANSGKRRGMYRDARSGVTISSGDHDDPDYIVVMPDGTVHDPGVSRGDLDIQTVQDLLDTYSVQA